MAILRHVLVDLGQPAPHPVIDVDVCEAEPGTLEYPQYHDTVNHRWIESAEAEIGWTWTEEGGLMAA